MEKTVTVIGAGLSGCEAAIILSRLGFAVELIDAKPNEYSQAHTSGNYGELVCSNSLKSNLPDTASGLLKDELRELKSPLIEIADSVSVAAGSALAVDRELFSKEITRQIRQDKNIRTICCKKKSFDKNTPTILATGPLTMGDLAENIKKETGGFFYFYDAVAPIVLEESLDKEKCFLSSRYNKGTADYINCPLNKSEYQFFYNELVNAKRVELKSFEGLKVFEGCMPIEMMASRGEDSLRFGPLRPVGIFHPITKEKYYAVVQLRKENAKNDMYNLVGFQTNLTFGEQKRVFSMIPALKNAEFVRYGVMHRNSFIDAPKTINSFFQMLNSPLTFVAGQLSGVEGYVESIASGNIAARNIARLLQNKEMRVLPEETMIGSLSRYLTTPNANFQPMNANFGILKGLESGIRDKKLKKTILHDRGIQALKEFIKNYS